MNGGRETLQVGTIAPHGGWSRALAAARPRVRDPEQARMGLLAGGRRVGKAASWKLDSSWS